jgi:transketolase
MLPTEQYTSLRESFGETLLELARIDPRIVVLCPDLRESLKLEHFANALPNQFVEVGVGEQNMLGLAAGMALEGQIPFAVGYAAFNPGRNWDQLRVSVAYSKTNVKVVGSHAGLNVGPDGATHQALEDLAITRVLPNIQVISPTDPFEMTRLLPEIVDYPGPVYLRFGRENTESVTNPQTPFKYLKASLLKKGEEISIFATGNEVKIALDSLPFLAKAKLSADVVAIHSLKPLDSETILQLAKHSKFVVSLEEAQIIGGLGGALAELLSEQYPTHLLRLGVNDQFGQSGSSQDLQKYFRLDPEAIAQQIIDYRNIYFKH